MLALEQLAESGLLAPEWSRPTAPTPLATGLKYSIVTMAVCLPFMRYSASNNCVTLKFGLQVTQGRWK